MKLERRQGPEGGAPKEATKWKPGRQTQAKTGSPPTSNQTLAIEGERRSLAVPADGLDPEAGAPYERRGGDHYPLGLRPVHAEDGLCHHGDPDTEEEVIVLEHPESRDTEGPKVLRAPRVPTQKEIDEHNAAQIPREEWCEFCMAGRARNKPHRQKPIGTREWTLRRNLNTDLCREFA